VMVIDDLGAHHDGAAVAAGCRSGRRNCRWMCGGGSGDCCGFRLRFQKR